MHSNARVANEAWEALYRAQATIAQSLVAGTEWAELTPREYGVLYALSAAPRGLQITELGDDVLLTQPGMSRLVARLETRGLVERAADPDDGRASRIRLSASGIDVQRRVGLSHARAVSTAMTNTLDRGQLIELRDLCRGLTTEARSGGLGPDRRPIGVEV
jgi:DNA-binding MarR family transcriptional regulator